MGQLKDRAWTSEIHVDMAEIFLEFIMSSMHQTTCLTGHGMLNGEMTPHPSQRVGRFNAASVVEPVTEFLARKNSVVDGGWKQREKAASPARALET